MKNDVFIGVAWMCALAAAAPAQAQEMAPCSERYPRALDYPLRTEDIGRNPAEVLARWGVARKPWGLERMRVVRNAVSGAPALEFFYPAGSINPANPDAPKGGAEFYVGFDAPKPAACLRYRVFFPPDFAFAKGGKLPGLYGGRNEKGESASGCRQGVEAYGFSTRYMWREGGAGSLYAYLPGKSEKCGKYIGKGAWHFTPGEWTTLEQEVVLNHPGLEDGAVRVWADGKLVIDQGGLKISPRPDVAIDGIFFVSFFGGKEREWASPKDQFADFADLRVFLPR